MCKCYPETLNVPGNEVCGVQGSVAESVEPERKFSNHGYYQLPVRQACCYLTNNHALLLVGASPTTRSLTISGKLDLSVLGF